MAHMNESWHIWMSHGTYEWVMAHMNESWHIWMSHGMYVPLSMKGAFICVTWLMYVLLCCSVLQCVAVCCSVLQCVAVCCSMYVPLSMEGASLPNTKGMRTSPICGDVTHSHVWHDSTICVTQTIQTCDTTHSPVRWLIPMGWLRWVGCLKIQVSLQNTGLFCRALLQKRPIILSILLIVATPYQTPRIYRYPTSTGCAPQLSVVTWRIHMCDTTHSYVWHEWFRRVTRLIHMWDESSLWDTTHSQWSNANGMRTSAITYDVTNSYVWRDTFIRHSRARWLVSIEHNSFTVIQHHRDAHLRYLLWRDSFICATWHIHMCDMNHSYVWRGSFTCEMTRSYET